MSKKSKLVVFLLSIFPGLGHFYLGYIQRGIIFMGASLVNACIAFGLGVLRNDDFFTLLLGLPLIWFAALVDSMMLAGSANCRIGHLGTGDSSGAGEGATGAECNRNRNIDETNKKLLACLFSVVPGAGHMYLGYQRLGLELMTLFFFFFFLIDWLRVSFFMFIIPVIWFYSMFDAFGRSGYSGELTRDEKNNATLVETIRIDAINWNKPKLLGYALIGIGLLLIFDRVVSPLIPYNYRNLIQTSIVALLFIYGGIKIITGGKGPGEDKEVEGCVGGE